MSALLAIERELINIFNVAKLLSAETCQEQNNYPLYSLDGDGAGSIPGASPTHSTQLKHIAMLSCWHDN